MKVLSRVARGLVFLGALLFLAGREASALELVQSEGKDLPSACVTTANGDTATGTPVLAVACGAAFAAYWQFKYEALEGPGTANGVVTCLSVNKPTKEVILRTCKIAQLLPPEEWVFFDGFVVSLAFGTDTSSSYCLDSNGNYSNTDKLPTTAQLTVTPCTLTDHVTTSTQTWRMK
jgi:hypothetical protein